MWKHGHLPGARWILLGWATAVLVWGCGGGGASPAGPSTTAPLLTQDQYTKILVDHVSRALAVLRGALSQGVTSSVRGEVSAESLINRQYHETTNCPLGGYRTHSISITGSLDRNNSGALLIQEFISYNNCVMSQGCTVVRGDPYISIAGTSTWLNGRPSVTQNLDMSSAPPITQGNCPPCPGIQANVIFSTDNGNGTYTGFGCDGRNVQLPLNVEPAVVPIVGAPGPVPGPTPTPGPTPAPTPTPEPAPGGGVSRFDGSYSGSYSGSFAGQSVSGPVAFSVSNGSISVSDPGSGSGNVDASGSASFTGRLNVGGDIDCTFNGTFTAAGGSASASGRWSCSGGGSSGNGSWNARR